MHKIGYIAVETKVNPVKSKGFIKDFTIILSEKFGKFRRKTEAGGNAFYTSIVIFFVGGEGVVGSVQFIS